MLLQLPSLRRSLRAVTVLALLAAPGYALEDVRAALSGIPWLQRVVRDGISLQVDLEPLAQREDSVLREKDRVAVRLHISDVTTGLPLDGLDPVAWLGSASEASENTGADPESCLAEAQEIVADGAPEPLRATGRPGTYETVARLGRPGRYEIVFFVGAPRLVHCFQVEVRPRGERG
jgi:hypothetical protein